MIRRLLLAGLLALAPVVAPAMPPAVQLVVLSGPQLLPQTVAVIGAMTVKPTPQYAGQMNTLVGKLLACGTWPTLDALWIMSAQDSQSSLINWVRPGTFTLTQVGTPTFTANQGWVPVVPNSDYFTTGITENAGGLHVSQNDAEMGLWSLTNNANVVARSYDFGGQGVMYIARSGSTSTRMVIRPVTSSGLGENSNGWYPGYIQWNRTAAAVWAARGNGGAQTDSGTDASAALTATAQRVLAATGVGGGANQLSIAHEGSSWTAAQSDCSYAAFHAWQIARGNP